jgi:hypothetical protein
VRSLELRISWEVSKRDSVVLVRFETYFLEELSSIKVYTVADHIDDLKTGSTPHPPVLLVLRVISLNFFHFFFSDLLDASSSVGMQCSLSSKIEGLKILDLSRELLV